ncbi:MAG: hypothetical protein PHQ11_17195 [Paludibacter sp.]|jgi:ACT domain-containing protein|nr:hypothetical protein [Paludibacter sp.]
MPFSSLLLSALTPDSTLKENNIGITFKRNQFDTSKETILLFHSDDEKTHFRNIWLRKNDRGCVNSQCCDGIIFYHSIDKKSSGTICFVELKGNDIKHAVEQILQTYKIIKTALFEAQIQIDKIRWKAVIISSAAKPKNNVDILKPLTDVFEKGKEENVIFRHIGGGNNYEITNFIRS